MKNTIPTRAYGKTGIQMPILSLGGAGVLQDLNRRQQAVAIIREAVESGIYYLDTAVQYANGNSETIFGEAIQGIREKVFLSTKSANRSYDGAWRDLHESLKRLRTDRLDQWIVHHVSYPYEIDRLFAPNGAMKAFQKAKEQKLVRYIGVSGHNDPRVLRTMLERFPFDMVLFPLNPAEPYHPRTFAREFMELAAQKGIGLAVMKVMGVGRLVGEGRFTVNELFRYALSHPIHTAVILPDSLRELRELVQAAREFRPLSREARRTLEERAKPFAMQVTGMYHQWP
ncbi:MAG: aldo/keto reductase [Armatimonadota bacterium]|nr:aldo/keto reductase [bacterium]MDW8321338.1 aldo/keto reductase [Armatimonadota bacterium]